MCRARIPARVVNSKVFGGEDNKLTFVYTKTTKMIQVQGSATLLDKAEDMLKEVLKAYGKILREGDIHPLPEGGQAWGNAIKESLEQGSVSQFLEDTRGKSVETFTEIGGKPKQVLVPEDEAFSAAVADLCNEGARKLHQYPAWRNKYLQFMLREFNASTDQVLELSELSEKMESQDVEFSTWSLEEGREMSGARPKAMCSGYRPVKGSQTKKEF
eukprot:s58_g40.t1